jgi:hypothetical protein
MQYARTYGTYRDGPHEWLDVNASRSDAARSRTILDASAPPGSESFLDGAQDLWCSRFLARISEMKGDLPGLALGRWSFERCQEAVELLQKRCTRDRHELGSGQMQ